MKKILTLLFSLATTILVAQQLPNYGFENWTSASITGGGTYENLNNWTTTSNVSGGLALTVTRSTNAYAGTYSAELKSGTVLGTAAPGLICQCEVNAFTQKITGGVAYTGLPTGIQAYIEYTPVAKDSMYIVSMLTKWDAVNHKRDTLATAVFFDSTTLSGWTKVAPSYYYFPKYTGTSPDTMMIAVASSKTATTAHTNSDLLIDNLEFLGVTATDNIFSSSYISVYPNPAQSVLNIHTVNTDAQYADVYDVIGNRLQHVRITSNITTLQLNTMADGVYLYRITNAAGQSIKTGKVTVAK